MLVKLYIINNFFTSLQRFFFDYEKNQHKSNKIDKSNQLMILPKLYKNLRDRQYFTNTKE